MKKILETRRFVAMFAWAESLVWETTSINGNKHTHILSAHIFSKDGLSALGLIVGPINLSVGFKK